MLDVVPEFTEGGQTSSGRHRPPRAPRPSGMRSTALTPAVENELQGRLAGTQAGVLERRELVETGEDHHASGDVRRLGSPGVGSTGGGSDQLVEAVGDEPVDRPGAQVAGQQRPRRPCRSRGRRRSRTGRLLCSLSGDFSYTFGQGLRAGELDREDALLAQRAPHRIEASVIF